MPESVIGRIEKTFGLPPLSRLAQSLEKFPDARQLKLIKETLEVAERISKNIPELDKVVTLVTEINSMPLEKLTKLERILAKIESIIKKAPDQLIEFLSSLKEE